MVSVNGIDGCVCEMVASSMISGLYGFDVLWHNMKVCSDIHIDNL